MELIPTSVVPNAVMSSSQMGKFWLRRAEREKDDEVIHDSEKLEVEPLPASFPVI